MNNITFKLPPRYQALAYQPTTRTYPLRQPSKAPHSAANTPRFGISGVEIGLAAAGLATLFKGVSHLFKAKPYDALAENSVTTGHEFLEAAFRQVKADLKKPSGPDAAEAQRTFVSFDTLVRVLNKRGPQNLIGERDSLAKNGYIEVDKHSGLLRLTSKGLNALEYNEKTRDTRFKSLVLTPIGDPAMFTLKQIYAEALKQQQAPSEPYKKYLRDVVAPGIEVIPAGQNPRAYFFHQAAYAPVVITPNRVPVYSSDLTRKAIAAGLIAPVHAQEGPNYTKVRKAKWFDPDSPLVAWEVTDKGLAALKAKAT